MHIDYYRAGEKDILDARSLFNAIFEVSASDACWRRKYFENPAGPVVAFAARDGERLVGFYPLHPARFILFGKETLIYQSADTMTDPGYRRKGVYSALRRAAHEWLVMESVPFTFGFPNVVSLAANKRSGFEVVGRLTKWAKPLPFADGEPLRRTLNSVYHGFASLLNPPGNVRPAENLDRFDERIDAVWAAVKSDRLIAGIRTGAFLEWRYGAKTAGITAWLSISKGPDGYLVAEKTAKGFWIRDLVAEDGPAVYALLAAAIEHAKTEGARHVIFPYIGHMYRGRLLRAGFVPVAAGGTLIIFPRTTRAPERRRAASWYASDADRDLECV